MKMFYMGGPLFMGILTLVLIAMLAFTIYHLFPVLTGKQTVLTKTKAKLKHIRTFGSFAAVSGILGQLVGLYEAFNIIEEHGNISQSLLAGGLKVSTIPTIYGLLIFLLSIIIWFIADNSISTKLD